MICKWSNMIVGTVVVMLVAAMIGVTFAAIPLYRLFCAATGYGGTPSAGLIAGPGSTGQIVRVRFNANINPDLPWTFEPDQQEIALNLGDEQISFYHAANQAGYPGTGIALYNVTPEKVGKYFHKTACFCFNKQKLYAHQRMEFPVSFWVDPAIRSDPNTADVKVITLSYTFFRSLDDVEKSGGLAKAGPHIGPMSAEGLAAHAGAN
jgi:cytochrome c oxidase assembly protein subunit 11